MQHSEYTQHAEQQAPPPVLYATSPQNNVNSPHDLSNLNQQFESTHIQDQHHQQHQQGPIGLGMAVPQPSMLGIYGAPSLQPPVQASAADYANLYSAAAMANQYAQPQNLSPYLSTTNLPRENGSSYNGSSPASSSAPGLANLATEHQPLSANSMTSAFPSMNGALSPHGTPFMGGFPTSPAMSQGSFGGVSFGGGLGSMMGLGLSSPNMSSSPYLGSFGHQTNGRTVYVGNLPAEASVDELLNQVRFGPIDNVKIIPEKSCAFISFLDPATASAFHADACMRKVQLHGNELKIGWGKPSNVSPTVMAAVQTQNATRNVYLGNLDPEATEETLWDDLSRFGHIDQVKIVRDKNIGFVHFLSIATAVKVVNTLPTEPEWAGRRVNYGKDRCSYVPRSQHQQQQHNMAAAAMAAQATGFGSYGAGMQMISPYLGGLSPLLGSDANANALPGNRTIYLGNIHPDTTVEEICNSIRGGILQQIRYIADKHIAFVTFVDPNAALAFYHTSVNQGITIHQRRLKVGWGKHSGPASPGMTLIVNAGGSRNIYLGNIDESITNEKLYNDFKDFGEIELVNRLPDKNAAFVNFTNIQSAVAAIEKMKNDEVYGQFKIAFGKDRCGNPPRINAFRGPRRSRGGREHSPNPAQEEGGEPVKGLEIAGISNNAPEHNDAPNALEESTTPTVEVNGNEAQEAN